MRGGASSGRWSPLGIGVGALALGMSSWLMPAGRAASPPPSAIGCDQPAGDPDPAKDPDAWRQRDAQNLQCATERQQDELNNPAFLRTWAAASATSTGDLPGLVLGQASEPTRPHASIT